MLATIFEVKDHPNIISNVILPHNRKGGSITTDMLCTAASAKAAKL